MAIDPKDRAFNDHLRLRGVRVANAYARKLATLRMKEAARVLALCRDTVDARMWKVYIDMYVNEAPYLTAWHKGLIINAGLPVAIAKTRRLTGDDAATIDKGLFEQRLGDYAATRAGENIRIVSGTMKDDLKKIVAKAIIEDENIGVEKLAKRALRDFGEIELWQARRIAQTEMMNGLAEAGHEAVEALDIPYTKTWCISGLGNTRETHEVMDGVTIDQNDLFELEDCYMRYPHDTSMNPPSGEIINCACTVIERPKR